MHLVSSGGWGGREMYPLALAEGQGRRGHKTCLVAKPNTPLAERLATCGIDYELLKVKSRLDLAAALDLSRILRRKSPELIHLHLSRDLALVVMACTLSRLRPAIILHQHVAVKGTKRDPFHRHLYSRLSAVVAVSQYVADTIKKSWPVEDKLVEVIFNGIDTDAFTERGTIDEKRRSTVRADLGVEGEGEILSAVLGRLDPKKGQDVFLKAAAIALEQDARMRFAVIGASEGNYGRHLEGLAAESGIEGRVVFTGFRPDINETLKALDVLAVPSLEEAFGLVAVEGMLSGVPVVGARAGALPEFIHDGGTGLLVPPSDPQALARSLSRLAADVRLRARLGTQARAWAMENLSLGRSLDLLDRLYAKTLGMN